MTQNQVVTLKNITMVTEYLVTWQTNYSTKEGAEKTGDFAGNWAGDRIVGILKGKNKQMTPVEPNKKVTFSMEDPIIPIEVEPEIQSIPTNYKPKKSQQLTDFEIAERMNRLLAGGKLMRKRKNKNYVMY